MKFIAGAGTGILATPVVWKFTDDAAIWTQNWSWIPRNEGGENTYVHAVSKMDPSGTPMRVRLVNKRPVRVLPSPEHPLGGGISSLAVAEVQMMHSPGRVKRPLVKGPDGGFSEIDWPGAAELLQGKLEEAKDRVAFISGDENGSTNEILSALAKALGSEDVFLMPSEGQCAAKACELMGIEAQLGYDFENSDYVLAIGANLLESWGTVVRNRRLLKEGQAAPFRNEEKGVKEKTPVITFAYAGPVQNNTAAVARPWLPIYPGAEGILALGIANMLMARGKVANAGDFGAFRTLASRYTPEETARLTGVDPKKLEQVVTALLSAKAPVVVVGSEFNQGSGAAPLLAGFAVNALLDNINKVGGVALLPPAVVAMKGASSRAELYKKDLCSWFAGKNTPAVLVMHEANPVYALPDPAAVAEAIKAVPFKVSFSTFMDESAALCDLVLPIGMGLERIDDLESPYGCGKTIYCISGMASIPQENIRSTANTLLYIARQMGQDLGFELFEDLLKAKALYHEKCSFDVLVAGQAAESDALVELDGYSLRPDIMAKALTVKTATDTLRLAPFAKLNLGTAKTGIPPYNNKTLRAKELDGALMTVMVNGATASQKGLSDGDRVTLDNGKRQIPAKLRVFEGVMNDTVAVCLGFGHTALDEFSQNKGANVMELLTAAPEPETGLNAWSQAGVAVSKS
ncbi:MAG: molybdopterin-dependent oxidoreductase [Desulfovibrio sp.]|jgi:anaerobic selenocysteine-containing dehydrogenase|nr:molybdopterin-dependent oxidoreductase [Desulfovibrio sp.]